MRNIIVVINDIRSSHNVGALLRTCDAMAVEKVIFSGYSPYPKLENDERLPHIYNKLTKDINKTALGAQDNLNLIHVEDIYKNIFELKKVGYSIVSLEQADNSTKMQEYRPTDKIVLIIGNELNGVESRILDMSDTIVEIEMLGKKESLNVASATAIALYCMRFEF